jgi:hypothetical protein
MNSEIEFIELIQNEKTNIRNFKKQTLIKLNKHFGYKFKKKYNKNILINNLLPIQRKIIIYNKIIKEEEQCPICLNDLNCSNYIITNCGHAFCRECIFKYITLESETCPICRQPYKCDEYNEELKINDIYLLIIPVNARQSLEIPQRINIFQNIGFIIYFIINFILFRKYIYFLIYIVEYFK